MNELPFPPELLKKHIAILGMTGSGKTSTAKRVVEEVVEQDFRVCVLDPIKSDWWGMISSASGKRPGLPFKILGGPKGHVPLHSSSGKVIGELVATGKLPLSIIDMADFEPGGLQRFFNDFADTLIKKMKGVLYLVIEEAHEFAPKERAGFGGENMSVHFAKKLATAGRSKGIRLIVATQRVQALHNALLGSCPTQIIHQLTLPADQEPVIKFLKANVKDKTIRAEIENSLSDLKTGECWIVSTLNQNIKRVKFPRIRTFDNSATPDDDAAMQEVKSAAVDQDELRAIIGQAVEDAEANDPEKLKVALTARDAMIRVKEAEIKRLTDQLATAKSAVDPEDAKKLIALRRALEAAMKFIVSINVSGFAESGLTAGDLGRVEQAVAEAAKQAMISIETKLGQRKRTVEKLEADVAGIIQQMKAALDGVVDVNIDVRRQDTVTVQPAEPRPARQSVEVSNGALPAGEAAILRAAIQFGTAEREQLTVLTGYKRSSRDTYINRLSGKGLLTVQGRTIAPTEAGYEALPDVGPLPTGAELRDYWLDLLPEGERKVLEFLISRYPESVPRTDIDDATGYRRSSRDTYLIRLKNRNLVVPVGNGVAASGNLF